MTNFEIVFAVLLALPFVVFVVSILADRERNGDLRRTRARNSIRWARAARRIAR